MVVINIHPSLRNGYCQIACLISKESSKSSLIAGTSQ
ncbi:hypothetical protein KEN51_CDS0347 [Pseudomonas phage vB_Pae10145-KEN51]|nr:hypothetical protein [Pseudomonas phage ANB1]WNV50069.1 hypothetical protein [Pseudomonas phage PhiPizzaParty]WRQ05789.1 hypothetical protein IPCDMZAV_CDS0266 [Pseudomonas phage 6B]WRQ06286.1 hypothetical protein QAMIJHJT_CDS0355 [Pseudomonas phage 9-Ps-8B]WRQ06694.1 hypothetical protein FOPPYZMZ_CDS0354 [Pseudomonas phage 9Ps-7B]WRQ07045.1 hypothetical protein ZBUARNPM_CDS0296 [Pseudomonas phage 14Ps5-6]